MSHPAPQQDKVEQIKESISWIFDYWMRRVESKACFPNVQYRFFSTYISVAFEQYFTSAQGNLQILDMTMELKHLLADMCSVVNYDELIYRANNTSLDLNNEAEVRKV